MGCFIFRHFSSLLITDQHRHSFLRTLGRFGDRIGSTQRTLNSVSPPDFGFVVPHGLSLSLIDSCSNRIVTLGVNQALSTRSVRGLQCRLRSLKGGTGINVISSCTVLLIILTVAVGLFWGVRFVTGRSCDYLCSALW